MQRAARASPQPGFSREAAMTCGGRHGWPFFRRQSLRRRSARSFKSAKPGTSLGLGASLSMTQDFGRNRAPQPVHFAKETACIGRHGFRLRYSAVRKGHDGFRKSWETDRDDDEDRRSPQADFGHARRRRAGTIRTVGAGSVRLPIDEVETVTDTDESDRGEERLIRLKRGQVANPCSA
jgi:hypothetical protein